LLVSMFHQQLLLHYAAKTYEGGRSAITNITCYYWAGALWRYDNAFFFFFTNQLEVDVGIALVPENVHTRLMYVINVSFGRVVIYKVILSLEAPNCCL
jgi:hypothetical protein